MVKYTIAILVRNQAGVLNRVTSMFRRRQFNIDSLNVSETQSDEYSRITVTYDSEPTERKLIIRQLYKLPDVLKVKDLSNDKSVNSELMLIKVKNAPETHEDIRLAAEAYNATTVDYTPDSIVMSLTGDTRHLDAFIKLMKDYTILEICRTGIVALERGPKTLVTNND